MKHKPLISTAAVIVAAIAIFGARHAMKSSEATAQEPRAAKSTAKSATENNTTLAASPEQVEELGVVRWSRDFEQATKQAKASGKPLFVLFTEVPGCSTVKGFGNGALSDPLIAEAIETHFIPVAVYNNVSGKDRKVLESFGEPTWNNPVVRIITHDRKPLAERFAGPYNRASLLANMTAAMKTAKITVPSWLGLLEDEASAAQGSTSQATFHMYCFWSGESKLGDIDGVVSSKTGFKDGREVVQVTYDTGKTSYGALLAEARKRGAADGVYAASDEEESVAKQHFGSNVTRDKDRSIRGSSKDDKYQLEHHTLRLVPMTPTQASRVNSALGQRGNPALYLSPRQLELARKIAAKPEAGWPEPKKSATLEKAWQSSVSVAAR